MTCPNCASQAERVRQLEAAAVAGLSYVQHNTGGWCSYGNSTDVRKRIESALSPRQVCDEGKELDGKPDPACPDCVTPTAQACIHTECQECDRAEKWDQRTAAIEAMAPRAHIDYAVAGCPCPPCFWLYKEAARKESTQVGQLVQCNVCGKLSPHHYNFKCPHCTGAAP